ncbi:hypothetical protein HAX54_029430, partial [Datura stramonium]|nr:hypothetical protein [Datura stramonium]
TMESKGKEVAVVDPSLKRARKGKNGASSSSSKVGPREEIWRKSGSSSWAYL